MRSWAPSQGVSVVRAAVVFALTIAVLPASSQVLFRVVEQVVVEQRLRSYKGNDNRRETSLKAMFESAGCGGDTLREQAVKDLKQPNLICVLPGNTDSVVVVGAHYDHVDAGDGVVDNWTGASMLPSLYEALSNRPRRHTYIFIAFSGEEKGLLGSRFYVQSLLAGDVAKIQAMVDLDTLGLGPTEFWGSRSDPGLVRPLITIARAMKIPLTGMNVEKVGESDEEFFIQRKVPVIIIHSLTQETLGVLHGPKDNYSAVHFKEYYESCRLLSGYLALLDDRLAPGDAPAEKTQGH